MCRTVSACFVVLSVVLSPSVLGAQSLADVSRAEEQRRKTIKTPSKVYTNKDLRNVPPPPAPATDASTPAADDAGAKDAKAADTAKPAAGAEPVKDQAYWAGRAKELQTQLERDRAFAEALQSRINALNTDFENRSDPAQRALVEQDRTRALAELERLNQAIQNDQKAIADFDDEARRAGVPPGWLR
jgi:hypothetical protein